MNTILFNSVEYNRLYNCTGYHVDYIPLEHRQHPFLGALAIGLFAIFELLYVPVLIAMWPLLAQCNCYKLMFAIGLVDVCALFICALLSGLFAVQGAVFCSWPMLNIWAGFLGVFFWCAETHLAIVLALNRLAMLVRPTLSLRLFDKWRSWIWVSGVLIYALIFAFIEQPLVWSSVTFSWFFDPHIGYMRTETADFYNNKWDVAEGIVVALSMPIIYLIYFCFLCIYKNEMAHPSPNIDQIIAKIIFFQSFFVCLINSLEATIYVLMDLFPTIISPQLLIFGTFAWISVHGLPPVIYLLVNKTLRQSIGKMLKLTHSATIEPILAEANNGRP